MRGNYLLCLIGFMKISGSRECTCRDDDYRPLLSYRHGYDDGWSMENVILDIMLHVTYFQPIWKVVSESSHSLETFSLIPLFEYTHPFSYGLEPFEIWKMRETWVTSCCCHHGSMDMWKLGIGPCRHWSVLRGLNICMDELNITIKISSGPSHHRWQSLIGSTICIVEFSGLS